MLAGKVNGWSASEFRTGWARQLFKALPKVVRNIVPTHAVSMP